MCKHNPCSSVNTPCFSSSCISLFQSVHFLHMLHPFLPQLFPPPSSSHSEYLHTKWWNQHAYTCAWATHPAFKYIKSELDIHTQDTCAYNSSQTCLSINNACWLYCSESEPDGMKGWPKGGKTWRKTELHNGKKNCIKNHMLLQLRGNNPLYLNNDGGH